MMELLTAFWVIWVLTPLAVRVLLIVLNAFFISFNFVFVQKTADREFTPLKWEKCPVRVSAEFILTFEKNIINAIKYSGVLMVHEDILNDFGLVIEANRCSLDMKTCEKYTNFKIGGICKKFENTEHPFYGKIFEPITPPLHCPIKRGNYSLGNPVVDFSAISALSIDGYIWLFVFKLVSTNSTTNLKKVILCYNTEVKIVNVRKKSRG